MTNNGNRWQWLLVALVATAVLQPVLIFRTITLRQPPQCALQFNWQLFQCRKSDAWATDDDDGDDGSDHQPWQSSTEERLIGCLAAIWCRIPAVFTYALSNVGCWWITLALNYELGHWRWWWYARKEWFCCITSEVADLKVYFASK